MVRVTRTTPLEGLSLTWPLGLALAAQARAEAPELGRVGARVLGFTPPASRDVRAVFEMLRVFCRCLHTV